MNIVAIVVQVLLGLAFLLAGSQKLIGAKASLERRDHLKVAPWFWSLTGALEVVAALGIVVGIWAHWVGVIAAALMGATMLGAIFTELSRKEPLQRALPGVILGLMALLVLLVRWPDFTHLFG